MEGIVLSRVTGRAERIAPSTLLTPKSVNDALNSKVQRCWVTPSQPSEAYDDGGKEPEWGGDKDDDEGKEKQR